jgi:hypothetical protein
MDETTASPRWQQVWGWLTASRNAILRANLRIRSESKLSLGAARRELLTGSTLADADMQRPISQNRLDGDRRTPTCCEPTRDADLRAAERGPRTVLPTCGRLFDSDLNTDKWRVAADVATNGRAGAT